MSVNDCVGFSSNYLAVLLCSVSAWPAKVVNDLDVFFDVRAIVLKRLINYAVFSNKVHLPSDMCGLCTVWGAICSIHKPGSYSRPWRSLVAGGNARRRDMSYSSTLGDMLSTCTYPTSREPAPFPIKMVQRSTLTWLGYEVQWALYCNCAATESRDKPSYI